MRFSLLTLLLATIAAGLLVCVFVFKGAWRVDDRYDEFSPTQILDRIYPPNFDFSRDMNKAPNGKWVMRGNLLVDQSKSPPETLFTFPAKSRYYVVDDNTILEYQDARELRIHAWRRGYSEAWWGHFYQPEAWAAAVFAALTVVSALRDRRARSKRGDVT